MPNHHLNQWLRIICNAIKLQWVESSLTPKHVTRYQKSCYDDVIKWKHFPHYWSFVRGIHRSPCNICLPISFDEQGNQFCISVKTVDDFYIFGGKFKIKYLQWKHDIISFEYETPLRWYDVTSVIRLQPDDNFHQHTVHPKKYAHSLRFVVFCCHLGMVHYSDVLMSVMASKITSLTIVYSTVYSGADQRKHQSSASLAFVRGIHRWPVNSPHKGPVMRKMFPFDDVIMDYRRTSGATLTHLGKGIILFHKKHEHNP